MVQSITWDGKPITKPGIYRGVPLPRYHDPYICEGEVSVSSSMMRSIITESPAHAFVKSRLNPDRDTSDNFNEAMALGRFVHAAVAGEPFDDDCVLAPPAIKGVPFNMRKKEWQEWKAEQFAAGKFPITPELAERAKGMILALGRFPLVQQGILGGAPERSIFWRDERGFWKKARPDDVPTDSADFCDLKTTHSISYRALQKTTADFGYTMQSALCMEGARAVGLEPSSFTILWVTNSAPYLCRATTLLDEDIARGHALNEMASDIFWRCYQANSWPGPGDGFEDAEYLQMPEWWRTSTDERVRLQLREAA